MAPTQNPFEKKSVLNPTCYQEGENVHMLYRAIDENLVSTIGYAKLESPTKIVERADHPIIIREHGHESRGVEDPRITKIEDTFYVTFTVHDGKNALVEYATSKDLKNFKKMGVISPQITYEKAAQYFSESQLKDRYYMFEAYYENSAGRDILLWEKDAILFPKKIKGKFAMMHRILPDIQIVYFDNFEQLGQEIFWADYLRELDKYVIMENKYWFESRSIGGGAVPIETPDGWLIIYHAIEELNKNRVYRAAAALLDLGDPTNVLGRLDYPLFEPDQSWETNGFVDNVVFPSGTAIFGDDLYIYYGAADTAIGVARVNLKDLIKELKKTYLHTIKI